MTTRIYYFTGTGNSLWAARILAERFGDTALTPIVRALQEGDTSPSEDRVGIVCPVYMYRLPHIVVRFIRQLKTQAPVFVVATMGGSAGDLFAVAGRLFADQGLDLAAGLAVAIQSNYAPFGGAPDDGQLAGKFERAEARLAEVAEILERGERQIDLRYGFRQTRIHPGLLYKLGYKFIPETDKNYRVDDGCDGCGICALVCPVDNVEMVDDLPTWKRHCEQCMACLQWCPHEVIQVKGKTRGQRRYHHPSVRSKDIVAQKKRGEKCEEKRGREKRGRT